MFRESMNGQVLTAPKVSTHDPSQWPRQDNVAEHFWGLVAHAYRDYCYYTGSGFPADKATAAIVACTDTHLLVSSQMQDSVMPEALERLQCNERGFFQADHLSVNLIVPELDRYLFAVNPLGETCTEKNLECDARVPFDANVSASASGWKALLSIPFAALDIADPDGAAPAFDIVRQEQGDAGVSTLTRAPVTPPYNRIYDYPVFHFSKLYLGKSVDSPTDVFADATTGTSVQLLSAQEVTVGSFCEIVVQVLLGHRGLYPGGRIRLRHAAAVLNCAMPRTAPLDWENVQTRNPEGAGYISVEGPGSFRTETDGCYTEFIYLEDKPLPPGEQVILRIGDRRGGGSGVRAALVTTARHDLIVSIDPLARKLFEPVRPWPWLRVSNTPAADILVSNPGTVPAGESFEICVRALDSIGNLAEDFAGTAELFVDAGRHTFPDKIVFTEKDRGAITVTGCILDEGVFSASLRCGRLAGQGNFVATDGSFGDGYTVFGDIHCHTNSSDGFRTPTEKMRECRFLRGLSFCALADHDYDLSPEKWEHYKQIARTHDQPGRFTCFLAYEWTPSGGHGEAAQRIPHGHYIVLFPDPDGLLLRAGDSATNTPAKLFAAARQQGVPLVLPHYHGGRPPIDPDAGAALEEGTPRVCRVKVAARPYPASVQLIKDGALLAEAGNADAEHVFEHTFTDDSVLAGEHWYLARVMLHGGEYCWSSPIWAGSGR